MNLRNFFAEMRRRNIYKVAVAYAIVTWLLIQVATQTFPFFEIPSWCVRLVIVLLLLGFPIAMTLAWAYELTPEGIKRTEDVPSEQSTVRKTGRKLDALMIGVLLCVIGFLVFQRFRRSDASSERMEKSIAVLPFDNFSDGKENAFFTDGIQDDILTSLAKIHELKVISRTSVMPYRGAGLCHYWTEANYEKALEEFSVAAAALPNDSDIGYFAAAIRRRQGRWNDNLELLKKSQTIDPGNANVAEEIAYTYSFLHDWPEAARRQERVIALAPDSVNAKVVRAYLDFWSQGSKAALKEVLEQIPPGVDPSGLVTRARWDMAMIQRDYAAADQALTSCPLDLFQSGGQPTPKSFYRGCVALARGDEAAARTNFEATLTIFEAAVQQAPANALRHANLGLVYSFMGRKEEAIREGHRAVELMPDSKDAVFGPWMTGYLAMIYARVGEADSALPLLEHLLASPGPVDYTNCCITQNDLRNRWQWDPLRNNPRFQKLLAEPGQKQLTSRRREIFFLSQRTLAAPSQ
jgi:tetratricopeptide (TPR) repeat protein